MVRRIVGVLGGLGPDATVDFMARVIAATPASKDQDHIHMIVDQNPGVPDRQLALLGDGESPGPALAAMARRLQQAGAEILVIPCNSAYAFAGDVLDATDLPLLSIVDAAVDDLLRQCPETKTAGLLAASGCLHTHIYQDALAAHGIEPLVPEDVTQKQVMAAVYHVKGGDQGPAVQAAFQDAADALIERGADAIIAGCTEITLMLKGAHMAVPLIDSAEALTERTVAIGRGVTPLPERRS